MNQKIQKDYEKLLAHWNEVFRLTEEDKEELSKIPDNQEELKELAPSRKLYEAAVSLKDCSKVLDYGCGHGWAGIIAAASGCPFVTCADPAPNAIEMVECYAKHFHVEQQVHPLCISDSWLKEVPEETYDGFFCSNVLDVIPPEMAEDILGHAKRIIKKDSPVIVSLNFHMDPETMEKRGIVCKDGNLIYMDDVLRLVNYSDEEWMEILSRYFHIDHLEHFAWPGEEKETRRLFYLKA